MRPTMYLLASLAVALLAVFAWPPPARSGPPGKLLVGPEATIAFLGDSITEQGWKHSAGYARLIVRGLESAKVRVTPIPAGVGGHIAREMRDRLKKDVLDKRPDWLLLSCGINDVWHLSRHKEGFDSYKHHITELVDAALKHRVKVVILTTTLIGEDLNGDHNRTLVRYNQFLRALAKEKRCLLADVDADFRAALRAGKLGPLMLDGVHLSPHGDQTVADCVLRAFGMGQDQLDRLHESWRDIPDAWPLRANHDRGMGKMFLVQMLVTIRQYERLRQVAAGKKLTVEQMAGSIHRDNIFSFITYGSLVFRPVSRVVELRNLRG